jgi:hypothetical protein
MKPLRVWHVSSVFQSCLINLRASPAAVLAQYVTLQTCFSHPSLGSRYFTFLGNPTNKTETGTANKQVRGVLIANHLDQSLWWWANQKHSAPAVRSYSLQAFLQQVHRAGLLRLLRATTAQSVQFLLIKKPSFGPKPACFDFFSFNFTLQIT